MPRRRLFVLPAAALFLTGCLSLPNDYGQSDVQSKVAARTGQSVAWRRDAKSDAAAARVVASLLASPLTPDSAVRIALLNNAGVQATFENLGIARAELIQASLPANPGLGLDAKFPGGPPSGTKILANVAVDFFDLLSIPRRVQRARDSFERQKLLTAQSILDLIYDVQASFYAVQARQEALAAYGTFAKQVAPSGRRRESPVNAATLEADRRQAQYDLDVAREALNQLLGLTGPHTRWAVAADLPAVPPIRYVTAGLESLAVKRRLDVQVASADVRVAWGALSGSLFDDASLFVGADYERQTTGRNLFGPMLQLELPVFDHGQARDAKAAAEYRQATRRLAALAVKVQSEVRIATDRASTTLVQAAMSHDLILPLRDRVVRLSQNLGVASERLARREQLLARTQEIEARRSFWTARAELQRAVGGFLPDSLPAAAAKS